MLSSDDPFTMRIAEKWRAWAAHAGVDPDRPTKDDLWKCYVEGAPAFALGGEDIETWRLFLEALAAHGYQAPRS